jgi:hypothetical protein
MNFWPEEYDVGASTSTLKGGRAGVKHIIQRMHEADLDYKGERTLFEFEFNEKKCN